MMYPPEQRGYSFCTVVSLLALVLLLAHSLLWLAWEAWDFVSSFISLHIPPVGDARHAAAAFWALATSGLAVPIFNFFLIFFLDLGKVVTDWGNSAVEGGGFEVEAAVLRKRGSVSRAAFSCALSLYGGDLTGFGVESRGCGFLVRRRFCCLS